MVTKKEIEEVFAKAQRYALEELQSGRMEDYGSACAAMLGYIEAHFGINNKDCWNFIAEKHNLPRRK